MMTRVSNGWGKVLPPGRNELNRSHDTTKLIFYLPHGGGGHLPNASTLFYITRTIDKKIADIVHTSICRKRAKSV